MAKSKYGKKPMSGGKKFLLALGVIVLLIALFFLSFWITTMSLRSNQDPDVVTETGVPAASAEATATPKVDLKKLSKKELIVLVEQKDRKIKELEEELDKGSVSTQAPISAVKPSATAKPSETAKATATPKPAVKTTAPTAAPTQKPAAKTAAPTVAPTQKPTTPTQAPATKAPIKPVAPAAGGEE